MTKQLKFRMLIAGAKATGKSAFIRRWGSAYTKAHRSVMFRALTPEASAYTQRRGTIPLDGGEMDLSVSEAPTPGIVGSTVFMKLLQTTDVFLLVYSVVNRASLEYLTHFMSMIPKVLGHRPIMIIVGTMIDRKDRQVSTRQGIAFARTHGCGYLETSSFVDDGVSMTVTQVLQEAIRTRTRDKKTPARFEVDDDDMSIMSDQSSYYGHKKRTSTDSDTSPWSASSSDSSFSDGSVFDRASVLSDYSSPPSTPCSSEGHFDFRASRAYKK